MRGAGTATGRGRRERRVGWLGAVVALALGSVLAGCSTVHESLGTSDSPCYLALPTAKAAVGPSGHFEGVRLMKVHSLTYARLESAVKSAGVDSGQVCLVAFSGNFSSTSVSHPSGRANGRLAVVVLRYPDGKLIATVLFRRLPTHFTHSHVG
jgi:hypothetical protein